MFGQLTRKEEATGRLNFSYGDPRSFCLSLRMVSQSEMHKKENKYPDFSISLYGINHIFNPRSDAFHSTNVTPLSYQSFLNARLPNHTEHHGVIRYDDVVLDINDGYLLSAYSVSSNDACKKDCKNAYGEQGGFDFPMVPANMSLPVFILLLLRISCIYLMIGEPYALHNPHEWQQKRDLEIPPAILRGTTATSSHCRKRNSRRMARK